MVNLYGKQYMFKPNKVIKAQDTIWAGDSFWISFVYNFLQQENVLDAVKKAMIDVEDFLENKQNSSDDLIFNVI